jgi:hypothetical protein
MLGIPASYSFLFYFMFSYLNFIIKDDAVYIPCVQFFPEIGRCLG